ncbi:winged helix-turn-helix domain-containing protein [Vibrio maerlii]|uniref:winged helix-turn-helix domain-containing protein n=1 Tax=Vibrio maerlii TaxID=2231648 RepID=UPI000E3D8E1E|nr:crosslink repair DNA glycosylase YcaQ family protein [Vibrio maerlii]
MTLSISKPQAQKIALHSQGLPNQNLQGSAYNKTVQVMSKLGYVQIDTISVVQRAHHHTLWSRNHQYVPEHLDRMVREKVAFEYWSHAASYLAMKDFRFSLPRKHALKSGKLNHWFKKNPALMNEVVSRIASEGPLMAKDFESSVIKKTGWESKPTKQALESLYMQGDLMISERRAFHKVYDLTERVLPSHVDTTIPSEDDYARFLVLNTLRTHGLARLPEMTYLLKGVKSNVQLALEELIEEKLVLDVFVGTERYYALPESLDLVHQRLSRKQAKILSPFDNFIIQRNRLRDIFDFDYQLECYVPAPKRKYGYFVLPVLWDGRLVARVDCKAHRKDEHLEVINLYLEPRLSKLDEFQHSLNKELLAFTHFNQCASYSITNTHH